jgi:acetylornithine deacetylase/succinyl-diaminopimelate desuccinylase-like protein
MNEAVSLNTYFFIMAYSDEKAQIAVFIYATHALELVGTQLARNLKLAFVVDEETVACFPDGTRFLLE